MILIGLSGPKGVGKTTVANHLENRDFTRLSFAWALKEMLTAGLDLDFHSLTTLEKEIPIPDLGVTPRHLMQTLGTEWGRGLIAKDIWIRILRGDIKNRTRADAATRIVVDDVRFDNEAAMIRELGGKIVALDRFALDRFALDGHASERGLSPEMIDLRINLSDVPKPRTCAEAAALVNKLITKLKFKTEKELTQ